MAHDGTAWLQVAKRIQQEQESVASFHICERSEIMKSILNVLFVSRLKPKVERVLEPVGGDKGDCCRLVLP